MDSFVHPEEAQGQATYDLANLRPGTTGLPFVVWISQRAGARHDVRVKVAHSPKVTVAAMGTYALRPFRHVEGPPLAAPDEALLRRWVVLNEAALVDFWDGKIEYTEDVLNLLHAI